MLFKLIKRNIKRSFRDYVIYFGTLILSIAIFYVFNSLDSQPAWSGDEYPQARIVISSLMGGLSFIISFIVGFLILYANNYIIKRRKKEIGLYMLLGMSQKKVSFMLLSETIIIGFLSYVVGIIIGIFVSQVFSLVTMKFFDIAINKIEFVLSYPAIIKTLIFYGITFSLVAVFGSFGVSRFKLIDLLMGERKNEEFKVRKKAVVGIIFVLSCIDLFLTYYFADYVASRLWVSPQSIFAIILGGALGTYGLFYSGFSMIFGAIKRMRKFYFSKMNAFLSRQLLNRFNTDMGMLATLTVLFTLTLSVFISGLGLKNYIESSVESSSPFSFNITVYENAEKIKQEFDEVAYRLGKEYLKDSLVVRSFRSDVRIKSISPDKEYSGSSELLRNYLNDDFYIMLQSDFNKLIKAKNIGEEELTGNEVLLYVPDGSKDFKEYLENELSFNRKLFLGDIQIEIKKLLPQQKIGNFMVFGSCALIIPDKFDYITQGYKTIWNIDYNFKTGYPSEIDKEFKKISAQYDLRMNTLKDTKANASMSRVLVIFVILYLGITLLIASAAVMALKELTGAIDSKKNYQMLSKLGADDMLIKGTIKKHMRFYFFIPLLVAFFHNIFAVNFITKFLNAFNAQNTFLITLIAMGVFLGVYLIYYYITSRMAIRIIVKEE